MDYLVDSVILIDHLNGINDATLWFAENYSNACLSVITRAEVLTGVTTRRAEVKMFLDQFQTVPITIQEADLAAELRQKFKWKLPDALQAAIAQSHNLLLVTRNTKDFPPKKYSFVDIPYRI